MENDVFLCHNFQFSSILPLKCQWPPTPKASLPTRSQLNNNKLFFWIFTSTNHWQMHVVSQIHHFPPWNFFCFQREPIYFIWISFHFEPLVHIFQYWFEKILKKFSIPNLIIFFYLEAFSQFLLFIFCQMTKHKS